MTCLRLAALIAVAAVGCADQGRPASQACAATGILFVSGQPAANASIAFHPEPGAPAGPACPVALTDSHGRFTLTTYQANDGAPPGEYSVTVVWIDLTKQVDECLGEDPTTHDLLHGRYADPHTTWLHADVRADRKNDFTFMAEPGPKPVQVKTVGGR